MGRPRTSSPRLPKGPEVPFDMRIAELTKNATAQKGIDPQKFQEACNYYNGRDPDPEKALGGIKLYFWRLAPKIDTRASGLSKYSNIDVFECLTLAEGAKRVEPLPADLYGYIANKHGGGTYRVSLNDKNLPQKDNQIAQAIFKIDDQEFMPVLDPRTLVQTDRETATWIQKMIGLNVMARDAQGNLVWSNEKQQPQTMEQAAISALTREKPRDPLAERSVDFLFETLQRSQQSNPVAEIISAAKAMQESKGDNGMMALVMQMVTAQQAAAAQMNQFLLAQLLKDKPAPAAVAAPPAVDPIEQMRAMMEFAQEFGGGKAAASTGWFEKLAELLPSLLPAYLAFKTGQPIEPGAIAAAPAAPGIPGPSAPSPAAAHIAQPLTMDSGAGTVEQLSAEQVTFLCEQIYTAMGKGMEGDSYAENLHTFQPALYQRCLAVGVERFAGMLMASPFAPTFQQHIPLVQKFIQDFFDFNNPPDEHPLPRPTIIQREATA